ncbi:MAG: 5-(carboxyamino)imidazole ribonucleotide synthase [Bacteroidetes bacterium]|nr:5-(carboxyamino)imidazole ribonucleotide synthase [Bacteroidota bacterium]
MNHTFYNNFKLGVLGGGQLGRMLIQEAINFNIAVSILDGANDCPCRDICNEFTLGDLMDFNDVYNFGKKVDLLTIEIENVNVDALEKLEQEGTIVYPQSKILRIVQDKGLQKQFYKDNDIPTSDFQLLTEGANLNDFSASFPKVQKLRKFGYDGKGVCILKNTDDIANGFSAPSLLEDLVYFEKEIAVIVARNANGEVIQYDPVEMEFNPDANLVEFLFSPANIDDQIKETAMNIGKDLIEKLDMIGLLAIEMFVLKNGDVLVNEIAPRPHNSGHHTIETNITSQYEQHLRAIFNMPLGSAKNISNAVMINLLGENGFEGDAVYEGLNEVLALEGVNIHLYGKTSTKPFRKMGHVTVVGEDMEDTKKKALFVKSTLKVKA